MTVDRTFAVFVNLTGLNCASEIIPRLLIVMFYVGSNICAASFILLAYTNHNANMEFGFYSFIDVVQLAFPLIVRNCVAIDAYRKRKLHSQIDSFIQSIDAEKVKKNRKSFLINCAVWIIMNFMKNFSAFKGNYHLKASLYTLAILLPGMMNSLHDFLFVFYVKCLADDLSEVTAKLEKFNDESKKKVLMNFRAKERIVRRFSFGLSLTITLNFLLIILSLYWILMRLIYRRLTISTFLYFLQPTFCLWKLCSTCESFKIEFQKLSRQTFRHSKVDDSKLMLLFCRKNCIFQINGISQLSISMLRDVSLC